MKKNGFISSALWRIFMLGLGAKQFIYRRALNTGFQSTGLQNTGFQKGDQQLKFFAEAVNNAVLQPAQLQFQKV